MAQRMVGQRVISWSVDPELNTAPTPATVTDAQAD
jgi:hypothetical protein